MDKFLGNWNRFERRKRTMIRRTALSIAMVIALVACCVAPATADMNDNVLFQVPPMVYVWGADDAWLNAPIVNDMWVLDPDAGVSDTIGEDIIDGVEGTPVITGTLTGAAPIYALGAGKYGNLMAISDPNLSINDNDTDGYLSTGDTLAAINLLATTDVNWADSAQEHSFYVASNCVFNIKAQSSILQQTGDFAAEAAADLLSYIAWTRAVTVSGTDDGLSFGANAQDPTGNGGDLVAAIDSLDDVMAGPTTVVQGGQRTASSDGTIATQSVRVDNTYTMRDYDLSQGSGTIEALVRFTIWKP
jgi:hypothetical protein